MTVSCMIIRVQVCVCARVCACGCVRAFVCVEGDSKSFTHKCQAINYKCLVINDNNYNIY